MKLTKKVNLVEAVENVKGDAFDIHDEVKAVDTPPYVDAVKRMERNKKKVKKAMEPAEKAKDELIDLTVKRKANKTPKLESLEEAKESGQHIYLFPICKAIEPILDCNYFGLRLLGANYFDGEENYVVKGNLSDLRDFAEYVGYELHPDYLYKDDEFAGEIVEIGNAVEESCKSLKENTDDNRTLKDILSERKSFVVSVSLDSKHHLFIEGLSESGEAIDGEFSIDRVYKCIVEVHETGEDLIETLDGPFNLDTELSALKEKAEEVVKSLGESTDKNRTLKENIVFDVVNGFHIEYGHSLEEYMSLWGDLYKEGELWDFSFDDVKSKAIEPNEDMVYWALIDKDGELRVYETYKFEEFEESCNTLKEEVNDKDIYYRGYDSRYGVFDSDNEYGQLYTWVTDEPEYALEYAKNNEYGKVAKVRITCSDDEIGGVLDLLDDVDYYDPGDEEFQECILDQGLKGYGFEAGDYDDYCICISKDCVEVIDPDVEVEFEESCNYLKEDVKLICDLSDYNPWSGAVSTWDKLEELDLIDELDSMLEEMYPEGLTMTQLNDILWFESDWIFETLGVSEDDDEYEDDEDEEEYLENLTESADKVQANKMKKPEIENIVGTDGVSCLLVNNRYQIYLDDGSVYDTVHAKDIPQYVFNIRDRAMKNAKHDKKTNDLNEENIRKRDILKMFDTDKLDEYAVEVQLGRLKIDDIPSHYREATLMVLKYGRDWWKHLSVDKKTSDLNEENERKIVEKLILEEPQDEEVQENEEEVEVEENEDEIEVDEQEVEVEEQEVEEDEPSREDEDRAVLSALTYAIQGCWARVDEYNSLIASLSDMDFAEAQEIADILREVTNSVLVNIGQLEKAIGIVSPQAELNVETGRNSEVEEEQEEIASDNEEVTDEVETTEVEEEEEMLPLEK